MRLSEEEMRKTLVFVHENSNGQWDGKDHKPIKDLLEIDTKTFKIENFQKAILRNLINQQNERR